MSNPLPTIADAAGRRLSPRLGMALLLAGGIVIGFAPILARLTETGPIAAAAWRLGLAALAILALPRRVVPGGMPLRQASRRTHLLLGLSGLFFAGDVSCFHLALTMTSVANATLLVNLAPVVVGLVSWLVFHQRPDRAFLTGLAVALAGAWALSAGASSSVAPDPARALQGDLLSLLAACFYAGYLITVKEAAALLNVRTVMLWSCAISAAVLWPLAIILGEPLLPLTGAGIGAILLLGIVVHAGGQGAITLSLAVLPVGFSSLVLLLQGVVAALAAWWLFDQHMTLLQSLGALAIVAGIILARRTRSR